MTELEKQLQREIQELRAELELVRSKADTGMDVPKFDALVEAVETGMAHYKTPLDVAVFLAGYLNVPIEQGQTSAQ